MIVHLGTIMDPKSISHISFVIIGEGKYFNIFSKAMDVGCFPGVYWDVVPCFSTIVLHRLKAICVLHYLITVEYCIELNY